MTEEFVMIAGHDYNADLLADCRKDVFRQAAHNGKSEVRLTHLSTSRVGIGRLQDSERQSELEAISALWMFDVVRAHYPGNPHDQVVSFP